MKPRKPGRIKAKTDAGFGVKKREQTTQDIADELDVTPQSVRSWTRQGCPHEDRDGTKYLSLPEVVAWMKQQGLDGTKHPGSGDPDIDAARKRKESALADKYELQVAKERRHVLPVEEVRRNVGVVLSTLRSKLMGIPAAVTPLLEGLDNAGRQTLIDTRIREAMNELADSLSELVGSDPTASTTQAE